MAERARRFEAERSAWIRSKTFWPDKAAASRRAERLARKARALDRAEAGLGETALHEGETKGALHRWTRHDDAGTSALGFIAFIIVYAIVLPIWFGLAWLVSVASYRAWESVADRHRVLVWPYLAAAGAAAIAFLIGRPMGVDLWLIRTLARFLESATGGWIGPIALSGWYAAGWVSWLEIQFVLGLAFGGWRAFAWGWSAPTIRRAARETGQGTTRGKPKASADVQIIGRGTPTTKADAADADALRIVRASTPAPRIPNAEPEFSDDYELPDDLDFDIDSDSALDSLSSRPKEI